MLDVIEGLLRHRLTGGLVRLSVSTVLAACFVLNGCAGIGVPVESLVTADDPCSPYRQPIAAVETSGQLNGSDVATAVATGTIAGVATGLLTGNARAGIGAALGGLLLTAGARYYQRQQQLYNNRQELLAAMYRDELKDGQLFAPVQGAVQQLRACRRAQFVALLYNTKSNRISHDAARAQFQTLQQERDHDNRVVEDALGAADTRVSLYKDAGAQANQLDAAMTSPVFPAPSPVTRTAYSHPLSTVVDRAKRADESETKQTDKTVDALRALLS